MKAFHDTKEPGSPPSCEGASFVSSETGSSVRDSLESVSSLGSEIDVGRSDETVNFMSLVFGVTVMVEDLVQLTHSLKQVALSC